MNNRRGQFQSSDSNPEAEIRLDAMLRQFRQVSPDPEASANFMPELWAKIERRRSSTVFSRAARLLVTAALATTAILSIMLSAERQGGVATSGVYMEALVTDGESALGLLNPDSLAELERQ